MKAGRIFSGASIACTWIVVLGLLDDRYGLAGPAEAGRPDHRGSRVDNQRSRNPPHRTLRHGNRVGSGRSPSPCFGLPLTDALNLLDGMDGMATVVGLILSLAYALAILTGHAAVALAAVVFAGALCGIPRLSISRPRRSISATLAAC